METVDSLNRRILGCRLCQDAGYIPLAAPVVSGRDENRIMLIGQAPGATELTVRRPFAGSAGRVLFGWMRSIGIEEETFRRHVYMTAITKCFPGKARSGSGDRRPSTAEIALCRPYLDAQLELIDPSAVLLVGGLAIDRYFPKTPLVDLIGRQFEEGGRVLIPLPHPSGASRWLNVPENRELLNGALSLVRHEWIRLVAHQEPALQGI